MGCNDYNLHLDGSEGNDSPTPEYNIYLDGVGVNGYSPTVDIVNENTASFQIQTNDINGSELTSPIPKLSYLQSDYVSNTSLASTLANYSTTAQIASDYLKVDGSNAGISFTVNGIQLQGATGTGEGIRIARGTSYNVIYSPSFTGGDDKDLEINYGLDGHLRFKNSLGYASLKYKGATLTLEDDKLYYGANSVSNELATIGDIPTVSDATITLTQGGVTKGTFTLNGSATTIDLDAGGSVITNPLTLTSTDGTRSLTLGINNSNNKLQSTYNFISGGSTFSSSIYLLAGKTDPITLTDDDYGKYTIGLKYDNDTIKVNQDGELYAVGGGTTYTAGTGIDITSDVISIDTSVVAQLSDIPDVSDFVTTSTLSTTLADYVLSSSLASVATSGSYTDLLNKPTIPTSSDYVDLISNQTIGGVKTFSSETHHLGVITFDSAMLNPIIRGMSGANYRNMIYRMGNDSAIIVGNSNDTIDLKGSGTRPTYNSNNLALYSDIPTNSNYVDLTTDQTVGGTKTFSNDQKFGGYIYLDGSSNAQGVVHRVGNTRKGLVVRNNQFETVYVGNTYDALQLSGSGTRPTYYANSTSKDIAFTDDIPSLTNYVTNTDYATTSVGGVVKVDGSTITIDANGVISASSSGGLQNTAIDTNSLTILGTPTTESASINIGISSTATRGNSVAIGNSANTVSQYSVAIGYNAKAGTGSDSSYGAVAIGYNAGGDYSKGNTVAIGNNAVAKSTGSIAIGDSAEVGNTNYTNGIAIGEGSQVYGANSINLGYGANTTADSFSVGFYGQNNNEPYTLLDGTTGLIPDARISSNIARTSDIPSISNLADKDLSNLSSTGEAHFLKPTITQDVTLGDSNTYNITVKAYNSNLDMNVACMQLYSSNNTLYIGNNGTTLSLRGDTTRPQYGSDDLALYSDISNLANKNLSNITTTGKATAADWGVPSASADVTYTSASHSTMNGTTFTNTTGYPCWLFITTGTNHTANCTVYAKNISASVENAGMTNAGIVNSQCIPVANGQQCQFFVYVPSGSVSWTATLHRMRGGL